MFVFSGCLFVPHFRITIDSIRDWEVSTVLLYSTRTLKGRGQAKGGIAYIIAQSVLEAVSQAVHPLASMGPYAIEQGPVCLVRVPSESLQSSKAVPSILTPRFWGRSIPSSFIFPAYMQNSDSKWLRGWKKNRRTSMRSFWTFLSSISCSFER